MQRHSHVKSNKRRRVEKERPRGSAHLLRAEILTLITDTDFLAPGQLRMSLLPPGFTSQDTVKQFWCALPAGAVSRQELSGVLGRGLEKALPPGLEEHHETTAERTREKPPSPARHSVHHRPRTASALRGSLLPSQGVMLTPFCRPPKCPGEQTSSQGVP